MLHDRPHPRTHSQAALRLVQARSAEAEEIIHQGLKQTDATEVFLALAEALRMQKDTRFVEDLLAALANGRPAVRQAAADTLADLADAGVILRLQARAE